jgi:hypothetical protein
MTKCPGVWVTHATYLAPGVCHTLAITCCNLAPVCRSPMLNGSHQNAPCKALARIPFVPRVMSFARENPSVYAFQLCLRGLGFRVWVLGLGRSVFASISVLGFCMCYPIGVTIYGLEAQKISCVQVSMALLLWHITKCNKDASLKGGLRIHSGAGCWSRARRG